MALQRLDRNNGYAKLVPLYPTLKSLFDESRELAKQIKGRKYGLTDEVIQRRTRPHVSQEHSFKLQYGISIYEYEEMFFAQDGKCAICHREELNGKLLATDHCHQTGKVRGLLCKRCNTGLGLFRDNIPCLISALEYLRK